MQKVVCFSKKSLTFVAMNTLSRHIEYLLLTHNYVVVPQFGAFVTRENSASHAESEDLFFPPNRVVRFNPDLIEDDGLLVGVVRALYRSSVAEAKHKVQSMVLDLRQQLLAESQVDFGSIGVFTQDEDGHVSFEPCKAGAVTPSFYGLDAFMMPKLSALKSNLELLVKRQERNKEKEDQERNIIIRINRRTLRYAAMTAAAVLVCVMLAVPSTFFPTPSTEQASLAPATLTTAKANHSAVSEKAIAAQPSQPAVPAAAQTSTHKAPVCNSKYCIVLASSVGRVNGERYIESLKKRGFEKVEFYDNQRMLRIVITGFQTEEEATARNSELHHTSKEFANTWVMKL